MPLNKDILVSEFSKFMDPDSEGFEGTPENGAQFAERFSNAINAYVSDIVPPAWTASTPPGAGAAAKQAAIGALRVALLTVGPDPEAGQQLFPIIITPAMAAVAIVAAAGMAASTPSVVAIPPRDPLGLSILASVIPVGVFQKQPAPVCINALATTIDEWFKTGRATIPPSTTPVPWS